MSPISRDDSRESIDLLQQFGTTTPAVTHHARVRAARRRRAKMIAFVSAVGAGLTGFCVWLLVQMAPNMRREVQEWAAMQAFAFFRDLLHADVVIESFYMWLGTLYGFVAPEYRWLPIVATLAVITVGVLTALHALVLCRAHRVGMFRALSLGGSTIFVVTCVVFAMPWGATRSLSGHRLIQVDNLVLTQAGVDRNVDEVLWLFGLPTALIVGLVLVIFFPTVVHLIPSLGKLWWTNSTKPLRIRLPNVVVLISSVAVTLLALVPPLWVFFPAHVSGYLGMIALILLPLASWLVFSRRGRHTWHLRRQVGLSTLGDVVVDAVGALGE